MATSADKTEVADDAAASSPQQGSVVCSASANGRVVVGTSRGTLLAWEGLTGRTIAVVQCHSSPVSAVALSDDGELAAVWHADGQVLILDLRSESPEHHVRKLLPARFGAAFCKFSSPPNNSGSAVSPGASSQHYPSQAPLRLAGWHPREGALVLDVNDGTALFSLPAGVELAELAFAEGGESLVICTRDGKLASLQLVSQQVHGSLEVTSAIETEEARRAAEQGAAAKAGAGPRRLHPPPGGPANLQDASSDLISLIMGQNGSAGLEDLLRSFPMSLTLPDPEPEEAAAASEGLNTAQRSNLAPQMMPMQPQQPTTSAQTPGGSVSVGPNPMCPPAVGSPMQPGKWYPGTPTASHGSTGGLMPGAGMPGSPAEESSAHRTASSGPLAGATTADRGQEVVGGFWPFSAVGGHPIVSPSCPPELRRPQYSAHDMEVQSRNITACGVGIYDATDKTSRLPLLLKVYNLVELSAVDRLHLQRQVWLHSKLSSSAFQQLWVAWMHGSFVFLVLDGSRKRTVLQLMQAAGGHLCEDVALEKVVRPLVGVVAQLHEAGVIHRDMCPENIIIDDNERIRLTSFDIAIDTTQEAPRSRVGTIDYVSPEVLDCLPRTAAPDQEELNAGALYTSKVDIWSIGILTFELLFGRTPFEAGSGPEILGKIKMEAPQLPSDIPISRPAADFIFATLQKDHRQRPTARDLLQHPWINPSTTTTPGRGETTDAKDGGIGNIFIAGAPTVGGSAPAGSDNDANALFPSFISGDGAEGMDQDLLSIPGMAAL